MSRGSFPELDFWLLWFPYESRAPIILSLGVHNAARLIQNLILLCPFRIVLGKDSLHCGDGESFVCLFVWVATKCAKRFRNKIDHFRLNYPPPNRAQACRGQIQKNTFIFHHIPTVCVHIFLQLVCASINRRRKLPIEFQKFCKWTTQRQHIKVNMFLTDRWFLP